MFRKSTIAILLCMAMLLSAVNLAALADTIIEIDTGGLWGDDILGDGEDSGNDTEDSTGSDNTGSDNTGENTENNNGNQTYIPEDNIDSGNTGNSDKNEEIQVVPPKDEEEKEDNKTTVLPTPDTGNTETPKEEVKEEETVNMVSFNDVKENDWFYNDVGTLAGMGIINGYLDGSFKPENDVTRAEFLKLLVTLIFGDNLMETYDTLLDVKPTDWYSKYFATAFVYGIIDINDYGSAFRPDEPITRREVAKLVSNSVEMQVGGYKTPFADTADHNIIALYRYAIMQGTVDPATGHRYFYPDTKITRAETAAVILRLYRTVEGGNAYVEQFMKDNNMPPLEALYVPTTKNDFYNVLTNAWDNNQAFVNYDYLFNIGGEEMQNLKDNLYGGYQLASISHPEYATYVVIDVKLSTYDGKKSRLTGEFKSGNENYTYESLMWEKGMAEKRSNEIATCLFNGKENGRKKADIIHDYITGILQYDDSYAPASYTAYGALTTGNAVCQGYSAVFNMLCRSAGVRSLAVANGNHMWNVVYVDGKLYHYDTTFDDTGTDKEKYKGIEESEFARDEQHRGYVLPNMDDFI